MSKIQGSFKGINRICAHCANKCKQNENVKIFACPNYKKRPDSKRETIFEHNKNH